MQLSVIDRAGQVIPAQLDNKKGSLVLLISLRVNLHVAIRQLRVYGE
jgi:hypothetical protein